MEERNQILKVKLDELTSSHMEIQNQHKELSCSNEKLVNSFAILEVAHEVMVTVMMSCVPINNTCSQNDNKEK